MQLLDPGRERDLPGGLRDGHCGRERCSDLDRKVVAAQQTEDRFRCEGSLEAETGVVRGGVLVDRGVDPGPGVRFHEDAVAVHGITPEIAAAEGIPPAALLEQFLDVLKRTSLVSGFHISFDLRMIRILSARVTGDKWDCETPKQCSMSLTNTYIKTLPKKPAGYKWPPTLGQSIGMIFDEEFPEAHRARPDCDAAARLYFELTKRLAA